MKITDVEFELIRNTLLGTKEYKTAQSVVDDAISTFNTIETLEINKIENPEDYNRKIETTEYYNKIKKLYDYINNLLNKIENYTITVPVETNDLSSQFFDFIKLDISSLLKNIIKIDPKYFTVNLDKQNNTLQIILSTDAIDLIHDTLNFLDSSLGATVGELNELLERKFLPPFKDVVKLLENFIDISNKKDKISKQFRMFIEQFEKKGE